MGYRTWASFRFERLGGFRNILVHEYMTVDLKKVYERLQNGIPDFENFIHEINSWIEKIEAKRSKKYL